MLRIILVCPAFGLGHQLLRIRKHALRHVRNTNQYATGSECVLAHAGRIDEQIRPVCKAGPVSRLAQHPERPRSARHLAQTWCAELYFAWCPPARVGLLAPLMQVLGLPVTGHESARDQRGAT